MTERKEKAITIKRRTKFDKEFTPLPNFLLRDPRISHRASGLLGYCLSLPEDWTFRISWLIKKRKEKRDALRRALLELQAAGYLTVIQNRKADGTYDGLIWEFNDKAYEDADISLFKL